MPAKSIFSGAGITFTMSWTVRVTAEAAGAADLSFLPAVRFAGARLAFVVAVGVAVAAGRAAAVRLADEPLEDLRFPEELPRFLVLPELTRCFTGVVATGVVDTGAAGAGGGVAATVVTVESELLLPLVGLFLPVLVVAVLRLFAPLVLGGLGSGVGATTVVTPVESV
jgi:hypothetical protein